MARVGLIAQLRGRWPPALRVQAATEYACRAGYAARGFVYLSVGLMALAAALRLTPRAHGAQGALVEAWAGWAPGPILLWLTGVGLSFFVLWRLLQSVFDADRQGHGPGALGSRAGQALSGLIYGALAISVFELVDTLQDLREPDEMAATRATVEHALALPFGPQLVIAAGVFVVAAGIGNIVQAALRRFDRRLDCAAGISRWACMLGRWGYLARGLTFLPAGALMIKAGLHARAAEATGLGGALEILKAQPLGHLVLGLVGAGLVAFGLFAFAEARFRRMGALEEAAGAARAP